MIFVERVDTPKGSEKRPMTADEVIEKFKILAGKVLPQERVEKLQEVVFGIEKLSDVRELAELLVP